MRLELLSVPRLLDHLHAEVFADKGAATSIQPCDFAFFLDHHFTGINRLYPVSVLFLYNVCENRKNPRIAKIPRRVV